jgi:hypothetical protein
MQHLLQEIYLLSSDDLLESALTIHKILSCFNLTLDQCSNINNESTPDDEPYRDLYSRQA